MPQTNISAMIKDFPELNWASNTTLNITGKRSNGMSIILSDEVGHRTTSGNISGWVLASNLDTGAVANSTWYYLYAVPDSNGTFLVKASITKPTYVGGVGPTGYSSHRYIGCLRTDASGNILRFFKDRGFYQFSPGVFDYFSASNSLNVYLNPGTTSSWTIALNGLTKYPQTSQLVKFGTNFARTNGVVGETSFQEQISGVYYKRAEYGHATVTGAGGNFYPCGFYECDVVNGVWQLVGSTQATTAIQSAIWVDGIREPAHWFQP